MTVAVPASYSSSGGGGGAKNLSVRLGTEMVFDDDHLVKFPLKV